MASEKADAGGAPSADGRNDTPSVNIQISRAIVRLLSDYTGRGPNRARTTINGNLVVCIVEDALTKGERVLVANGQRDTVLQMRASYQQAMSREATAAVEDLTGRRVLAFMSSNHADPDYGAEIFILDGASPAGSGDHPGV